jgi:hypothetical protein
MAMPMWTPLAVCSRSICRCHSLFEVGNAVIRPEGIGAFGDVDRVARVEQSLGRIAVFHLDEIRRDAGRLHVNVAKAPSVPR